ncbi:hypothetical protein [Lysinibacillus yapensis]|nr:hypothetical protein [Lysinibacillus yapensis]
MSAMVLAACSNDADSSTNQEVVETEPTEAEETTVETKPTETTEPVVADPSKEETEEETQVEPKVIELKPLTLEDFNNRYELDTEFSEPFIDGKFELKDGTIVYADWYFYLEGETFEDASAAFIDGQLVDAQLTLKEGVTKEEVLTELGLSEDVGYKVNEYTGVVDLVIDKRFDDANIQRLPSEWD